MSEHGLVLGKFMPPHRGHLHLVDFAGSFTSDLTVVVGSLAAEPIPGSLRYTWMRELCPFARVVHLTDENPQLPEEHPRFWEIWRHSLQRVAGRRIDLLFASEPYGARLAEELGALFIPTNGGRELMPVSGSAVRQDPLAHWTLLPPPVQAYYARRVVVFGPESTGKTTLAQNLARELGATFVPEYARTFLRGREESFDSQDMLRISRGQYACEQALARAGRPLLICDTDPLTTLLWHQELFGEAPEPLQKLADHDSYELTLCLDVDVPWVEDELRLRPHGREQFLRRCCHALEVRGRRYLVISGSWEERWQKALEAVKSISPRLP